MRVGAVARGRVVAAVVVAAAVACGAAQSDAAGVAKGPRIVAAAVLDLNGNFRADRLRLRYSRPVRHRRDTDGSYPFVVAGYRIASVSAASGNTLTLVLVERAASDATVRPSVRYRLTRSKPVTDRRGRQAPGQLFKATVAHRNSPPPQPPAPPPAPDTDPDKDGYAAPADCKPNDPAIHPGAVDKPDLAFVDSNCDGIDGDEAISIFVSPTGSDTNPGTKSRPKRQIQAAIESLGTRRNILVGVGPPYSRVVIEAAPNGIGIFGGYNPSTWLRSAEGSPASEIYGAGEGILIAASRGVVLQLLTVFGVATDSGASAYGIRAINISRVVDGASVTIQRVRIGAGPGGPGIPGVVGAAGSAGAGGDDGKAGGCDTGPAGAGGVGGASSFGRAGGDGGKGGAEGNNSGFDGAEGQIGTPGGAGGPKQPSTGFIAGRGGPGSPGAPGTAGTHGAGGLADFDLEPVWSGRAGGNGSPGTPGNGGGGGGGGPGQGGVFVNDGAGNGGGGGGAGGPGGSAGSGGGAGGGSFGLYLYAATVRIEGGSIDATSGGPGGDGGKAGAGGAGGTAGLGSNYCSGELAKAGDGGVGGAGGSGGGGGGGAGGPSVGIMQLGSKVTRVDTTIRIGQGGAGGVPGIGGTPSPVLSATGVAQDVLEIQIP